MFDRRRFIGSAAGAISLYALPALAQRVARPPRVGYLSIRSGPIEFEDAFLQGLRELGHVNGTTIDVVFRFADRDMNRAKSMATELLDSKVDIMVTPEGLLTRLVKDLGSGVPIVMPVSGDPVAAGLVASFARPGGNITGLSLLTPELNGKRVEIFKAAVPGMQRLGALYNVTSRNIALPQIEDARKAASALDMSVVPIEIRVPGGIEAGFADAVQRKLHGVIIVSDTATIANRDLLGSAALARRLPTIFSNKLYLKGGGLMSYGPDILEAFRRSASYVDRILKGAKPGELPIELPTRLELAISLKTARAIGIKIPDSTLLRADHVIE